MGLLHVGPGEVTEEQAAELRDLTEGRADIPARLHQVEGGEAGQEGLGPEHDLLLTSLLHYHWSILLSPVLCRKEPAPKAKDSTSFLVPYGKLIVCFHARK